MGSQVAAVNWLSSKVRTLVHRVELLESALRAQSQLDELNEKGHGNTISIYDALMNEEATQRTSEAGGEAEKKEHEVHRTSEAGGAGAQPSKAEKDEKKDEEEEEDMEEDDDDELYNLMMNEACTMELELELEKEKEKELKKKEKEDEEDDEVEMTNFFMEAEKKAAKAKSEMGCKGPLYDMKKGKTNMSLR